MGKFQRSWQLVKQSFAILRSDKELLLLPVVSAICCLIVTGLVIGAGIFTIVPQIRAATLAGEHWQPSQPLYYLLLFLVYFVNFFIIVFFNVALVGVANSRLMGGAWTIGDGLSLAWARKGTIVQWAFVAATVGIILRSLEERMGLLGRIIIKLIGIAWTLACYFVVPVLAFEDLTPLAAIRRSSKLFKETWGERVIGGFSFGLVFLVLALPGFGVWIVAMMLGGVTGMIVGGIIMVLYFLLLSVASSAVQGIFNTALYRYACFKQVPAGFDPESFAGAWTPKK
jgi:Family of unknown function (DUF6159)